MDILDFSDLSEDWVSQPQSSDPADAKDNLVLRSSVRSKIPIPSRRSVSNPYKVLHEKTASDNNSYCSTNILRISSREIQPEAFSETIQRKDAAKVTDENQETPEWKKKLLRGNGKSQDLFSPIGLQGVFKPPTIKTHTMPKSRSDKLGGLINIPPSSPPAMPGQLSQISTLSVPEESLQLPPLRAPSQTGPKPGVKGRNGSTVSSNKSAISHERFSPVMFGSRRVAAGIRQTSIRDNTRYPSQEFKRSLSSMSDSVLQIPAARSDDDVDSVSLPEYSELDSEHISLDQKFITTKRGGFSADGSFKIRPLTPSSYQPGILSSIPPTDIVTAPDALITPKKPLSTLIEESPQRHKSSGSPLKLFDKYDTFTNDRLNCRVSQFEGREGDVDDLSIKSNPPTPSPQKGQAIRREQRMSSFGEGRLDEFDFTHNTDHGHAPKWPSDSDYNVHGDDKVNRPLESPLEYGDAQHVFKPTISKNIDLEDVLKAPESDSEIKRMPSSPQRVSYPKRRRTNDHDPESECDIDLPRQRPLIKSKSSIAGKKWKDARHGDHNIAAGPEVLAERQILEPISSVRKLSLALGVGMGNEEPQYINVNTATDILANQLASLALNVAEDVTYGNRKKSVTTADFFKEAHIIMQHIRTQAAQDSQTPSVIVQKSLPQIRPSGFQDELFSNDDLDRPASREGGGTPRKRGPVLTDRVVSHLKKFADSDDLGLAINSSFNILKLKDIEQDQDLDSYTSDRSDIRILDPPRPGKSEGHAEQYGTGKTDSTGNTTTSIPTGSSGTRSKAIIEPHKISHLLADTMGGMTFDHQRQCWVKRKSLDSEQKRTSRLESEMTEDDPFAGIPDLDDDLLRRGEQIAPRNQSSSRPTTAYTHDDHGLASSGPVIDTRATSWSTAQPNRTYLSAQDRRKEQMIESALLHRGSSAVSQTKSKQPRAVTVAFSSPPIQPSTPTGNDAQGAEIESIETPNDIGWSTEADRIRLRNHLSSSVVKYTPRPLSRIDEMDNSMELVNSSPAAHQDMSLRVVTPAPRQRIHGILVPATNRSYVSMQLTPLQDFTVHQIDDSLNLDVQYVARKQGLNNQFEIEDRFSISVKELVAKIADIEPYEPYWEYMKELDLSNNGLVTLHMLDEFCSRLETLSIDGNELGQLNGAPGTIRMLSACSNCFSDLTAWDHLYNLQYLDVSGNELRSLKGFSNLVHLRELRADNNQIQSLDGVTHLDGLLRLSLVNNAITEVDLKASRL